MRKQEKEELALLNELARRQKEADPYFGEELIKDEQVKEFLKKPDLDFLQKKDIFIIKGQDFNEYDFLKANDVENNTNEAKDFFAKYISEHQQDPELFKTVKTILTENIEFVKRHEEKLLESEFQQNIKTANNLDLDNKTQKLNDKYFSLSTSDILDKLKMVATAEQEQQEKAIQNMNRGLDSERQFK